MVFRPHYRATKALNLQVTQSKNYALCLESNNPWALHQWSRFLPLCQRIINSMPSRVTGLPPAKLLYGDAIDLSRNLITVPSDSATTTTTFGTYVRNLIAAQKNYAVQATSYQQRYLDRYLEQSPTDPDSFSIGSLVLVRHPTRPPTKLHPKWQGPYKIIGATNNKYTLSALTSSKEITVHIERLKQYLQDPHIPDTDVTTWDANEYLVDQILNHRGNVKKKSRMQFLVQWHGYDVSESTWEPYSNVKDLAALTDYIAEKKLKI